MKITKRMQGIIAWAVVFVMILTTGSEFLADEITTEEVEESQVQEALEVDEEVEQIEQIGEPEVQQPEVTAETTGRKGRAYSDVSGKFSCDVTNVTFASKDMEDNNHDLTLGDWPLSFNVEWKQEDSSYIGAEGDYVIFDLFKIESETGDGTSQEPPFKELPTNITLTGKVGGDPTEKELGKGSFLYDTASKMLQYKVVFGPNIAGNSNIQGSFEGKITIKCSAVGDKITITKEDGTTGSITVKQRTTVIRGTDYPEVEKAFLDENVTDGTLSWRISASDIAGQEFENFADSGSHNPSDAGKSYDHLIITDTLDEYQSFQGTDKSPQGILIRYFYYIPILKDMEQDPFAASSTWGQSAMAQVTVDLKDLISQGKMSYKASVAEVMTTANTFNITDGELVINLGAPGNGGLKLTDIMPQSSIDKCAYITNLELRLYEYQLEQATAAGKTDDNDDWSCVALPISECPGESSPYGGFYYNPDYTLVGRSMKLGRIREIVEGYELAKAYYADPASAYMYSMELRITTDVDVENVGVGVKKISNSWKYQRGEETKEQTVSTKNSWNANISAEPKNGEIVLFKADKEYSGTEGALNEEIDLGEYALGDVEFKVYDASDVAVKFTKSTSGETNGKYVLDGSGSEIVKTDEYGCLILSGLQAGSKYTIKETKPLSGYADEAKEWEFTVDASKALFYLMENAKIAIDTYAVDTKVIDPLTGAEVAGSRTPGQIQKGSPSANEVIADTVTYMGLTPGETYVVDGRLWEYTTNPDSGQYYREFEADANDPSQDTGNGDVVQGELRYSNGGSGYTFVADSSGSGTIEVFFSFNGKNLGLTPIHGSYLVAHEVIYKYDANKEDHKGEEVARHTDNEDIDQTIHYIHGSSSHLYSTSYTVSKTWDDENNAAGDRPDSIEVQLYSDDVLFVDTVDHIGRQELSEDNGWTYTWNNLPQYQEGTHTEIVYTVKEVSVPDNYEVTEEADGTITNTHKGKGTEVEILKVDENDKPLAGAELELYDANGTLVASWTSTDKAYVLKDKLIPGATYTLKEKKAPEGYLIAKDVSFTVSDTEITKVKMVDVKEPKNTSEKPKTPGKGSKNPKTGDNSKAMMYLVILLGAALLMGTSIMFRRHMKR
ncbi:Cna B-type domain-containing protein [Lachnospiraceae bacterium OttesenSCG-928-E19]|nr:Cna B-type domain-containing protein [Lachnospiraceae bacterium OttesenSCG-928-E19]